MQGYDLDDTLASVDFTQAGHRPFEELFAAAPVIYTPSSDFVVITGRPHDTAAERAATTKWLTDHQPHYKGIHYVAHGSDATTAKNKAAIIKRLKLSDYTDNNTAVLKQIATLSTGARLWTMNASGDRTPFAGVDRAQLARDWAPTLT